MKKISTLLFLSLIIVAQSNAATWIVKVANFQFTPATVNANVGDIIVWEWVEGGHTTTSGNIPGSATKWDAQMNSGNRTFEYTLTAAGTYSYVCTPHADFMTGTINVGGALPLKFGDFSIREETTGAVSVNWQALTESNLAEYVVKRSADGTIFETVGKVPAKATATNTGNYTFSDLDVSRKSKFYYYFIEAVDKDGRKTLSAIKMVRLKNVAGGIITSISPNPISSVGHLMIKFNAEGPGKLILTLYNSAGVAVNNTQMQAAAGVNSGHWHLGQITPGKYYLQCQLGTEKETTEVMVIQ